MGFFPKIEIESEGDQQRNKSLDEVKAYLQSDETPKKKRGRKRKTQTEDLQAESVEIPESLFNGENWKEIAVLPFNIRKALTGSEIFTVTNEQKTVLGESLALVMKTLININPKYVALSIFSINLVSIWSEKEILYRLTKKPDDKKTTA